MVSLNNRVNEMQRCEGMKVAVNVPFATLETSVQTWGKCHLALACEAELGKTQKTGSYM